MMDECMALTVNVPNKAESMADSPPKNRDVRFLLASLFVFIAVYFLFDASHQMASQEDGFARKLLLPIGMTLSEAFALTAASTAPKCPPRKECNDAGFINGTWVHRPHRDRGEMTYVTKSWSGGHEREFRNSFPENTSHLSWNQYDWETFDACCPFYFFNAERMCKTFAKLDIKRMLIVGDSIAEHTAMSLLGLMQAKGDPQAVWKSAEDKVLRMKMCGATEGDFTLMYLRNDVLYTDEKQRQDISDWSHSVPWVQLISGEREPVPDLLMVNVGPHVHEQNVFENWVDGFSDYLKDRYSGHLVYRTYTPGHPNCWEHQDPGDLDYDYDGYLEPQREGEQYHDWWHQYKDFNNYARKKLASHPNFSVLEVEPIARRRTDGHMGQDCLHYHLPGPPDWWMIYFYNMMETMAFDDQNIAAFHQQDPDLYHEIEE